MADQYTLVRDIIEDHSKRMLNIKKYYPYFKLTENAFSQFQGGKYNTLDMGYILMAVLRFFIEKNNFEESDVEYEEYFAFICDVIRRDFELPLDEEEQEEVCEYIFDKISNGGRPFTYEYFDPEDKSKKTIRMRLVDSRIRDSKVVYFITSDAIEFYLDTKEIKDESSISIAQVLLSKMITTKNFKGGIDVIKRINNEVGRLKVRKNEVLAILSEDVFAGAKAYEEFVDTGIKWFEDEQRLFAKNMELVRSSLSRAINDETYIAAIDDIYQLEMELKKTIIRHSELLSACTDLQVKADEIIKKAKLNRLRPGFDFSFALKMMIERDRADLMGTLVIPLFRLNTKKSFDLVEIDKLLSLKGDKNEVAEKVTKAKTEDNYVYEDELEEQRIDNNYQEIIKAMLDLLLEKKRFFLKDFNEFLEERFSKKILVNGDYYSMLVHMCQKKKYDLNQIVEKPDTFFESYLKEVVIKDADKYEGMVFYIVPDNEDIMTPAKDTEISGITFSMEVED